MDICIFGASGRQLDKSYYDAAYELGEAIAAQRDSWARVRAARIKTAAASSA